jgi:hypothetical protein
LSTTKTARSSFSAKSDYENRKIYTINIKNKSSIRGAGLCWARGTDCIIDVRITDVDAKSNLSKDPARVLAAHEREEKKK